MFNLIENFEGKETGFTADLIFGPRGNEAIFDSEGSLNIVNQLLAYCNVSDRFKLTLGDFNTFLGYEVILPTSNFNYFIYYMFSYGPFSLTDLKADIDLGDGFSSMIGIFNPTDFTDFNPFGKYVGSTQLGYKNDKGGLS